MKNYIFKTFLTVIGVYVLSNSYAQPKAIQDTVYYLLDTSKIPKSDRIISEYIDGKGHFFNIACSCLKDGGNIELTYSETHSNPRYITKDEINALKFSSLGELISKTKDYVTGESQVKNHIYVFYIIQPGKKFYMIHEVRVHPWAKSVIVQ